MATICGRGERVLDRLRARPLDRLRETVRRAYAAVPHYRTAFDAVGLHPDDVRSLDDLAGSRSPPS